MGKRIISRARGKGGPPYKSPSHRFVGKTSYSFDTGEVIDIIHDPGRDAPLAKLKTNTGEKLIVAANGLKVGDIIDKQKIENGNILPVKKVPKGWTVFGIETHPGSGPKLCNSPGTKATIISQESKVTIIQMPSKEFKKINPNCSVTIGIPAGGGRKTKPFVKAGQKHFAKHARNKLYPRTSATAMNAVDHPFGGKGKPGIPRQAPRSAPPGRKVGSIAPKRTGKRKR
jgi:large subunit ribosomal protein L2